MVQADTERVMVYVDGFNLYYGMKESSLKRYYWLDLGQLAESFLQKGQRIAGIRYFTAPVYPSPNDPDKPARQTTYLDALSTVQSLSIHRGYFMPIERRCQVCGARWRSYEEKMTDVNIAVELLRDAYDDAFDVAVVVSGDSDLAGPIAAVRSRWPDKKVVVAFPPGRRGSKQLREAAAAYKTIGRTALRDSQFPDVVAGKDGYPLARPAGWR